MSPGLLQDIRPIAWCAPPENQGHWSLSYLAILSVAQPSGLVFLSQIRVFITSCVFLKIGKHTLSRSNFLCPFPIFLDFLW